MIHRGPFWILDGKLRIFSDFITSRLSRDRLHSRICSAFLFHVEKLDYPCGFNIYLELGSPGFDSVGGVLGMLTSTLTAKYYQY